MNNKIIFALACVVFLGACKINNKPSTAPKSVANVLGFNFAPDVRHSTNFTIQVFDGYKRISVLNPWKKNDTLSSYILYPKGSIKPNNLPKADFIIPVPINEIAIMSSTHIGFIDLLGELDKVIGVSSASKMYNEYLSKRYEQKRLSQIGRQTQNNLEIIFDLAPELLMKVGFDNVRDEDTRLVEAGIPIAYNIEWMESTMLGRAEWIKFVAAFFNKDQQADSIFNTIEYNYQEVIHLAQSVSQKPTVLSGSNHKGTWSMPGGNSYMAKLIADAGGDYFYKNESSKGSIPLSFEIVLDNLVDADFWFGPRAKSLHEIEMMDERYALFKAFQQGNVYTFDNRVSANGGNDYWESGVARPDEVLKDIMTILHPDLSQGHKLVYYRKLNQE